MSTQRFIMLAAAAATICRLALARGPVCPTDPSDDAVRPTLNFGEELPERIREVLEGIPDIDSRPRPDATEYQNEEENFAELERLGGRDVDPSTPSIALPGIERSLRDVIRRRPGGGILSRQNTGRPVLHLLRQAHESVTDARSAFFGGSATGTSHLCRTMEGLHGAQVKLEQARKKNRFGSSDLGAAIEGFQVALAETALHMAEGVLTAKGVDPDVEEETRRRIRQGNQALERFMYVIATNHFGGALDLASNSLIFDIELFKNNVVSGLAGNVVGYSLSIAWQGQLYDSGQTSGLARTSANSPQTPHAVGKEMHVVSVSKPITTIVLLRLLEINGETPDSLIEPFLPSDWEFGDNSDQLTFRHLLTHTSNFGQNGMGNTYQELKDGLEDYVQSLTMCGNNNVGSMNFCYNNGNFGLMRVAAARLLGFDLGEFNSDSIELQDSTSQAIFLSYAQDLYNTIGVGVNCQPLDNNQTIQYNFPHNNLEGYEEPDRRSQCGGIGWHVSSNELASIMAHLRLTNNLLSNSARDWMQVGYLGYMSPSNYGWIDDNFGTYYMHGGDWFHGAGEAHACALAFPIHLQVGLVINSARAASMPYQCLLVQQAFEDAWV